MNERFWDHVYKKHAACWNFIFSINILIDVLKEM